MKSQNTKTLHESLDRLTAALKIYQCYYIQKIWRDSFSALWVKINTVYQRCCDGSFSGFNGHSSRSRICHKSYLKDTLRRSPNPNVAWSTFLSSIFLFCKHAQLHTRARACKNISNSTSAVIPFHWSMSQGMSTEVQQSAGGGGEEECC